MSSQTWFTAVLVLRAEVAGDLGVPLHDLQYHLIAADGNEEAYQHALALGRAAELSYDNPGGQRVTWHFDGLHDLLQLDGQPEHGAELYSRRVRGNADQLVVGRAQLSCFFLESKRDQVAASLLVEEPARVPSIHDSLLTGYEVNGATRTITLHTETQTGGDEAFVDVIFTGVVGYQFEGDAMSNIIFGIEPVPSERQDEIANVILEQQRQHGGMPGWDRNAETFQQHCARTSLTPFCIQSSYGLDGWVLAAAMTQVVVARIDADSLDADGKRRRTSRAREIQAAIGAVLLRDWDPIGVRDEPLAQDEYDSYVGGVYRLIASGASAVEIAEHLASVQTEMMGLPTLALSLRSVAERLAAIDVRLES